MQHAAQLSFVGELAAGLAHEIKNPLAGIQGAVDILIRRRDANDPEREALEGIRHEVERIDGTVRALLDRARPRAMNPAQVSLTELTLKAVNVARSQAIGALSRDRRVHVIFDEPEDEMIMDVDAPQIEDAVLNLILNAIDAIPEGGTVTVRTSALGAGLRLEVSDTGQGLTPEECARLFTPYYTTKNHGTGLGLAIVQSVVSDHHGRISVESEKAQGTTFRIELYGTPSDR